LPPLAQSARVTGMAAPQSLNSVKIRPLIESLTGHGSVPGFVVSQNLIRNFSIIAHIESTTANPPWPTA